MNRCKEHSYDFYKSLWKNWNQVINKNNWLEYKNDHFHIHAHRTCGSRS